VPSKPRVSGLNLSCRGSWSFGSNHPILLSQKMWNPGAIASGSSSVATLKSTVSGWWSTFIRKGVPHCVQNSRWPKLDEATEPTFSAPFVQTRSPSATLANTIAGAPLLS